MNIAKFNGVINKFCEDCNYTVLPDEQMVIFNNLLKRFMHLFKFENIDDSINLRELMLSIIFNDSYMIIEDSGLLRNVYGGYAGELDFYGYPTEYLWSTGVKSGNTKLTDGEVGHSNSLWTPLAPTLFYYTKMLSNLDKSLEIASINTRITPLYKASTDAERQQIDEVFNKMIKGEKLYSVMHKTTIDDLMGDESLPIDMTGKSGDSQYMPMILQAYDNVLARVCRELGINITNQMKRAQVISAEVNGYENYTQIFLDDMIEQITDTFDRVNARWNRDWKVSLSDAFKDDNPDEQIEEQDNEQVNEQDNEQVNEQDNEQNKEEVE